MDFITAIGLIAATFTTGSTLPQTLKVVKTKKTGDLSLLMYSMVVTGALLWITYGFLIGNMVLIAANSISLFFNLTVLSFKLRYK